MPDTERKEKGIDGDAPSASELRKEGQYRDVELDQEAEGAAAPSDAE